MAGGPEVKRNDGIQSKGFLAGKELLVHGGGPTRTVDELREYMRQFSTISVLRGLGTAYRHIWQAHSHYILMEGVPIPAHAIPYLALLSIEVGGDESTRQFDDVGLLEAARMFVSLQEPLMEEAVTDDNAALEHLLRQGHWQFDATATAMARSIPARRTMTRLSTRLQRALPRS